MNQLFPNKNYIGENQRHMHLGTLFFNKHSVTIWWSDKTLITGNKKELVQLIVSLRMKVKLVSIACIPEEQDWIKLDDLTKITRRSYIVAEVVMKLVSIACIPEEQDWIKLDDLTKITRRSYIVAEVVMKLVLENYHEAFTSWTPDIIYVMDWPVCQWASLWVNEGTS